MAAPNHGHARMEHLQEVNRKPLKDELLPQGPERGNFTAEDPHSRSFLLKVAPLCDLSDENTEAPELEYLMYTQKLL